MKVTQLPMPAGTSDNFDIDFLAKKVGCQAICSMFPIGVETCLEIEVALCQDTCVGMEKDAKGSLPACSLYIVGKKKVAKDEKGFYQQRVLVLFLVHV